MDVAQEAAVVTEEPVALRFPTGVILAALLAAWIGLMALAITNIAAGADAGFRSWVTLHSGIGPYSGKQLFMYVAWFVSWPVLHLALRRREMNLKRGFGFFLIGILVATLLMWPPIFEAIAAALWAQSVATVPSRREARWSPAALRLVLPRILE